MGDYQEAHAWRPADVDFYDYYLAKREEHRQIELENIAALLAHEEAR